MIQPAGPERHEQAECRQRQNQQDGLGELQRFLRLQQCRKQDECQQGQHPEQRHGKQPEPQARQESLRLKGLHKVSLSSGPGISAPAGKPTKSYEAKRNLNREDFLLTGNADSGFWQKTVSE